MRIPLFAYPWRVSRGSGRYNGGRPFWRLAVKGLIIAEPCDCDAVKDCIAYRMHGVYPAEVDAETGESYPEYDPRDDCDHRLRPPHRHWAIGGLLDAPIRPTGVLGVLREAARHEEL